MWEGVMEAVCQEGGGEREREDRAVEWEGDARVLVLDV